MLVRWITVLAITASAYASGDPVTLRSQLKSLGYSEKVENINTWCRRSSIAMFNLTTCENMTLPADMDVMAEHNFNTNAFRFKNGFIKSDFVAIVAKPVLVTVYLQNLTYYDASNTPARLPFADLLSKIKGNLKLLSIQSCNVSYVRASDFFGFWNLMSLELTDAKLMTFDWGILLPVAAHLQDLKLGDNGMRSIFTSRNLLHYNISLKGLSYIELGNNNLSGVPVGILKTLNIKQGSAIKLGLDGNPICCDCCTFSESAKWFRSLMEKAGKSADLQLDISGTCRFRNGTFLPFFVDVDNIGTDDPWFSPDLPQETFAHCKKVVSPVGIKANQTIK